MDPDLPLSSSITGTVSLLYYASSNKHHYLRHGFGDWKLSVFFGTISALAAQCLCCCARALLAAVSLGLLFLMEHGLSLWWLLVAKHGLVCRLQWNTARGLGSRGFSGSGGQTQYPVGA